MEQVMVIIQSIMDFLSNNSGPFLTVMGILMVIIAKVFPNANANIAIASIQKIVDFCAKLFEMLGKLCKMISDILAQMIKSDGFLGKK